jgi:hypothetical protein
LFLFPFPVSAALDSAKWLMLLLLQRKPFKTAKQYINTMWYEWLELDALNLLPVDIPTEFGMRQGYGLFRIGTAARRLALRDGDSEAMVYRANQQTVCHSLCFDPTEAESRLI